MGIEAWSTTPASNNAASPDGFPEGMTPGSVNDAARQVMASVREWYEDAQWIDFGHVPTRTDNDTFTIPSDLTAIYHVGRRLKVAGSATGYCTIATSTWSTPNTVVDVTMDTGNLPATLTYVYVSILSNTNDALPSIVFNSSNQEAGTLPDARLSSNVPLKDAANTFTASQTVSHATNPYWAVNRAGAISYLEGTNGLEFRMYAPTSWGVGLYADGGNRSMVMNAAGNVTISAPSSGTTLTVAGEISSATGAGVSPGYSTTQTGQKGWFYHQVASGDALRWYDGTAVRMALDTGLIIGSPTGDDKGAGTLNTAGSAYVNGVELGFREVPQNAQTGNYTCVLADNGKHIYHASGAGAGDTYTIPANASVAYPVGTVLTFANMATDAVSIAITSDTLTWTQGGATGTRTLAQYGVATAMKVTSTLWLISGSNLS